MQITSVDQLLEQLYSKIEGDIDIDPKLTEKLQQIEQDNTSTLVDMKSDYITGKPFIDEDVNAAIVAFALGIEPTAENLLYIKRLGFSMGTSLQKLMKSIPIEDDGLLSKDIIDILIAPEEIGELLVEFDEGDLVDMAYRIDLLLALVRESNGEHIDISTRLSIDPNSQEEIQQHLDQIVEILHKLDMEITTENIEIVDKFMFVFGPETLKAVQVLRYSQDREFTLELGNLMADPAVFLKLLGDIHSFEELIDIVDPQSIYDRIAISLEQIQRYIALLPIDERREITNFLKDEFLDSKIFTNVIYGNDEDLRRELLELFADNKSFKEELLKLFESNIKVMEDNYIRATLYTKIESDIGETLQLQTRDDFPFWLVPILSHYGDDFIFGELWVNKESPKHKGREIPYSLSLWSDFDNLGRVEICIYGVERDIEVYMLCQPQARNLIIEHAEHIIGILRDYDLSVGEFHVLEQKSKSSVLSYLLASSRGIDKNLDIRV